ncbi:kelch domain-containing protein 9 [Protopterus annectens]|uniref:kelch domain-containing protein 9 n=1 Tax=Protopterus annectens TaxID=7888 RepID=UPI001CFADB55|nr:kelch domain-containing protein 9 [Protopterus annectens]
MCSADLIWDWKPVVQDELFARAFHTCNAVDGKLLIYGGVKSANAKEMPLSDTVFFNPLTRSIESLSPAETRAVPRSHHDAVVIKDRWLCAVGGWDGHKRVSSVRCFDAESKQWTDLAEGPSSDPPVGLSSHSCTRISDHELCVVGREGGLRMQRRYGSVYTLRINIITNSFWYREATTRTASRAGHTAMLLPDSGKDGKGTSYKLLIVGGREGTETDIAGRWSAEKLQIETPHAPKLTEKLSQLIEGCAPSTAPKNVRHQSCSVVGPFAVFCGGEHLGKTRDIICNDLYVLDTRSGSGIWYHFPCSNPEKKRAGHRTCLLDDHLYLVGGLGPDGKTPSAEICELAIQLSSAVG